MTAALAPSEVQITKPGVYDLPADVYHSDPVPGGSLSSSGARKLLPPSCPALFHHWATNPQPPKAVFDFGHAAHRLVLEAGQPLVVIDVDDWRTKNARQQRDDAYAAGAIPILEADHQHVLAMAAALKAHPIAGQLLQPGTGHPEQSLFWADAETGVKRRAMFDWLPNPSTRRRFIVADYKTALSASPEHLARAVHQYGYHQQAAYYLDGVHALDLAANAAFVFIFQEKTAPYLVTVVELDPLALRIGQELNRRAIELYATCVAEDRWPGYSDAVEQIGLPAWVERDFQGDSW